MLHYIVASLIKEEVDRWVRVWLRGPLCIVNGVLSGSFLALARGHSDKGFQTAHIVTRLRRVTRGGAGIVARLERVCLWRGDGGGGGAVDVRLEA